MPINFTIKDGQLIVKPEDLLEPIFEQIYTDDKSKEKKQATPIFKYVFFMKSQDKKNPVRDRPYYSKEREARAKAWKKTGYKFNAYEESIIPLALQAYEEGNEDTDRRSLETYNNTIEKMRVEIDNNPPEIIRYEEPVVHGPSDVLDDEGFALNTDGTRRRGKVSWVTNNDMLLKNLKEMNLVAESRDKLQERLNKANGSNSGFKGKGKYEKSTSEKGMIFAPGTKDKIDVG